MGTKMVKKVMFTAEMERRVLEHKVKTELLEK
jgi:hypothetical protein